MASKKPKAAQQKSGGAQAGKGAGRGGKSAARSKASGRVRPLAKGRAAPGKAPAKKAAAKRPAARRSAAPGRAAAKSASSRSAKAAAAGRAGPASLASHPLAKALAAHLKISEAEAIERALEDLAMEVGLHKAQAEASVAPKKEPPPAPPVKEPPARQTPVQEPPAPADAPIAPVREPPAPRTSEGNLIPQKILDTAPLPSRTMSVASSTATSGALPQRLYLALDGRGLDGGGMPIEIIDLPVTIGSSRRSTIWVNQPQIETTHAQIIEGDGGWIFEDLGSAHGTYLNGNRITRERIQDGDTFLLANYLRVKASLR